MEETEQIASTAELEESAEALAIRAWRLRQFGDLGFDRVRAEMMADDLRIDLAQARRLVALGCPIETAARILL